MRIYISLYYIYIYICTHIHINILITIPNNMIIVNIILSSAWHHCYRNHAPTLALASLPQRPRAYYIGCT